MGKTSAPRKNQYAGETKRNYDDGHDRIWGKKKCPACGDPLTEGECANQDCVESWRKCGWTEENAL